MRFIDHRVFIAGARTLYVDGYVRTAAHHRLEHHCCVVSLIETQVLLWMILEMGIVEIGPKETPSYLPRIRIEQQLVMIEAMTQLRLIRAVHTIAIDSTRLQVWDVTAEDLLLKAG